MATKTLIVLVTGGVGALVFAGTALAVTSADAPAARPAAATAALDPTAAPTDSTAPSDPAVPPGSAAPVDPSTAPAAEDAFSEDQARELAVRTAGGGQVTEVEREQEQNRPVWSVEVLNGTQEHEVDVDRETGKVNDHEQEAADDDQDDDQDDQDDQDDD